MSDTPSPLRHRSGIKVSRPRCGANKRDEPTETLHYQTGVPQVPERPIQNREATPNHPHRWDSAPEYLSWLNHHHHHRRRLDPCQPLASGWGRHAEDPTSLLVGGSFFHQGTPVLRPPVSLDRTRFLETPWHPLSLARVLGFLLQLLAACLLFRTRHEEELENILAGADDAPVPLAPGPVPPRAW